MTTETYLEIRDAVKVEIKILTELHTANKLSLKFNARYCDSNSAKFDPSINEKPVKPFPPVRDRNIWGTPELVLTCLHIFYNRLRKRKPHTSKDEDFTASQRYRTIEELFLEISE